MTSPKEILYEGGRPIGAVDTEGDVRPFDDVVEQPVDSSIDLWDGPEEEQGPPDYLDLLGREAVNLASLVKDNKLTGDEAELIADIISRLHYAEEHYELSQRPRIHTKTRKTHRKKAADNRQHAKTELVNLFQLELNDPEHQLAVVSLMSKLSKKDEVEFAVDPEISASKKESQENGKPWGHSDW